MKRMLIPVVLAALAAAAVIASAGSEQVQTAKVLDNNEVDYRQFTESRGPKYGKPSDEELHGRLSPLQYKITQEDATERPFANEYWAASRPSVLER